MSSITKHLHLEDEEEVIWSGELSWPGALLDKYAILTLGLLAWLRKRGSAYAITDKRVFTKYGVVRTRTSEASIDEITDVSVQQSIPGRVFRYGLVKFNTAGTASFEMTFGGVSSPDEVRKAFQRAESRFEARHAE